MASRVALLGLLGWIVLLPLGASAAEPGQCIDEDIKADLFAKRKHRGAKERLFQQSNRHELSALGGYYISDLFDGTYLVGGAYSYHMTEDIAVEARGVYTHLSSAGVPELERTFSVLGSGTQSALFFDADLVWSMLHGKLRLGGTITHLDLYLLGGVGIVDSSLSVGLAGNAGLGFKLFLGRAYALRFEIQDHVHQEQLLVRTVWENDLSAIVGLSLFLPLGE